MREGVMSMPLMRVNGAALYYEEYGTGPQTIVFAHGLLWSCRMFDAQVALLKDRYRGGAVSGARSTHTIWSRRSGR